MVGWPGFAVAARVLAALLTAEWIDPGGER
jgi:hypothetical protein